uniref:Uncharacterized protein n=1 Tax=Parascaris equorum TaxID=6256 RepID=A0A914RRC6_PAREQ
MEMKSSCLVLFWSNLLFDVCVRFGRRDFWVVRSECALMVVGRKGG